METHFAEHIFVEHTSHNTSQTKFLWKHFVETFQGTSFVPHFEVQVFVAQVLRYVLQKHFEVQVSRYKLQDRIFLPVQHFLVTK